MNNKKFLDLNNIFYNVYKEVQIIKFNEEPNLINDNYKSIENSKLCGLYNSLKLFLKELDYIKDNQILIQGFIDSHYNIIRDIKLFLVSLMKPNARMYHDKIFTNIFKLDKYIPLGITKIFEEFIKGITYFSDELEIRKKVPIYHRSASCGKSNADFQKKYLKCFGNNSPENIQIKKQHIFKCYVERLIYDNIYKKFTLNYYSKLLNQNKHQNEGHQFQLDERSKNFNSCFLGINLKINILYDGMLPYTLIISYIKDDIVIKKERYTKITLIDEIGITQYHDDVVCNVFENKDIVTYVQTFYDKQYNFII